jgi:hypothetical protein
MENARIGGCGDSSASAVGAPTQALKYRRNRCRGIEAKAAGSRAFSDPDAVEDRLQPGRVQHAGGRHRLALPRDAAEVPDAPEADVGLRGIGLPLLEGLDLVDFDAGAFLEHLAHVARAEPAPRVGVASPST